MDQIEEGIKQIRLSQHSSESFALIIDGKSLTYALEDDIKFKFLDLAIKCASVICCRSSPKQKALVSYFLFWLLLTLHGHSLHLPSIVSSINIHAKTLTSCKICR